MKNAEKLIKEVNKKIDNWNERSQFNMAGVKNLSRSDMDTIILYAETYLRNGNINSLMNPRGEIELVLSKYGIK